ncbi:MAG: trypsin-like peptidase domain-containing protein [Bacteroidales bacterium]|jgi:hypothetical protein|nr:trypsin-like peptidase domain-containing protein [Bacteroidales bacterium]
MRLYVKIFFMIVFGYGTVHSDAQNTSAWSLQFPLPELAVFLDFPEPVEEIEQVLSEEQNSNSSLKARVYAVGIETALNPGTSGQWDTITGKGYVWRIGIHAKNALSLNLLIENYRMSSGMALYVYNKSRTNIAGPFGVRNNANGGVLPVQSLSGDMIIVEWNIPLQAPRNDFTITSVGYGFRDIAGSGKIIPLATAATCNVDINCKTGNHWQREKRSVVRLETITRTGNIIKTQYCTGTLVNQAVDTDRKKPYILTANHCISTDDQAQLTTFVFGYEKAYCKGTGLPVPAGIAGSSLVAAKRELDFALLEMSSDAAMSQRPYYAGWNTSTATPQGATGIHHPQGDVKKISVENDPLGTGTFNDDHTDLHCDKDAHWIVRRWDEGTTEQGSSGSAAFDAGHMVVGTLSGGTASCSYPVNDYYSKFSEQWNRYPAADECLKPWLDPDGKGVASLWGYDPVAPYEGRCDTLGHIGENESEILVNSGEWGYLTSQNDQGWSSFAEKIKNDTTVSIIGMEVHVAKASDAGSKVRLAVWQGTDFPVTPLYTKDTIVMADYNDYRMHIYFDRTLEFTGNYFIGYSLEHHHPLDTFAVYQSAKRPYAGISDMYVEESSGVWMALGEYVPPIYSSLGVRVMGKFGKPTQSNQPAYRDLKIVFQPGSNIVFVYFESPSATVRVEGYDTSGKRMKLHETGRYIVMYDEKTYLQVELDVSNLSPGVYLIQAFDRKKSSRASLSDAMIQSFRKSA